MDAAGQVTQLGDGLLGAAVGGGDQLQDPLQVGLPGPVDHAAELLGGQPQLHGDGDHLRLRAVVQVPLDPAQPRGRVVHQAGPGPLQLTHPPRKRAVGDSDVPVAERQVRRPCRQERHRPPVRRPIVPTQGERNDAEADQDDTSANAHARQEAQAAVLP